MSQAKRTDITKLDCFTLNRPNNSHVTFSFPQADSPRPYSTRITLPAGSTWTPSPHWHERYTEYIQCLSGRLLLRLDGVEKVVTADDGPQVVERGVVHEFMRADMHGYAGTGDDEDVVVEEWTNPADGAKHVFFRNLIGTLEDEAYWGWKVPLQALLICARYDNFNVVVGGWAKGIVTKGLYRIVLGVASLVGLKEWYDEYTPESLRGVAEMTSNSW
jgi:quercetin dioxygenase-like cupin family protein